MKSALLLACFLIAVVVSVILTRRPVSPKQLSSVPNHSLMAEEAETLRLQHAKFGQNPQLSSEIRLNIKISDPIKPLERWQKYEEPIASVLGEQKLGMVSGGGTKTDKNGVIEYCDIGLEVIDLKKAIPLIVGALRKAGAPAGTEIKDDRTGKVLGVVE